MASAALASLPSHSFIFIDTNIFIYGLSGQSAQSAQFLERCLHEDVTGITLFETVNEATHRFMVAEALAKGAIMRGTAKRLRQQFRVIRTLSDYWENIERLLALNLLFVPVNEEILRAAQSERQAFGLLTNDSMIVACMREYGISFLATNDADFERVAGITVFRPSDVA